jgi:hypothetical protein
MNSIDSNKVICHIARRFGVGIVQDIRLAHQLNLGEHYIQTLKQTYHSVETIAMQMLMKALHKCRSLFQFWNRLHMAIRCTNFYDSFIRWMTDNNYYHTYINIY